MAKPNPHVAHHGENQIARREFLADSALLLTSLPAISLLASDLLFLDQQTSARADIQGNRISLANNIISARWQISQAALKFIGITDNRTGQTIENHHPAFTLGLPDNAAIDSGSLRLIDPPRIETLTANPQAARFADRLNGRAVTAALEDAQHRVRLIWRAILRDGSHYVRQELTLDALSRDLPIARITLIELDAPAAEIVGSVKGSPIKSAAWFFGFEHPLSGSSVESERATCSLDRQLPLEPRRPVTYSSVIGAARPAQFRRDFLRYIERERAHPYRTFLHYNSWYDLGYFTPYNQTEALDAIDAFGTELHAKRGVTLDSFHFDDGWDDHHSLWRFNPGFPRGFAPLKTGAARYGAAPGAWLSPWGGYDGPRKERLAYGKQHGYEENAEGFVLSGPLYFRRFHDVCMRMIREYGVNQFKFDGTGNAATVYPGSQFNSDFDAMIGLIRDLRVAKPDLYVNLTTGTYPSPFWLQHADSIWRGGEDDDFTGVGTARQRWITYRDAATYEHVVRTGPLYPLNSLMLHGLIYARDEKHLNSDPGHDFPAEVRSYFGTGTQLQEMYITHSLLSDSDWDVLARSAQWSRHNADILVDTHWLGGDPAKLEVYGWASWSPRGGIITLRNPDQSPHVFGLDPQSAFELPDGAPETYLARSPWHDQSSAAAVNLAAGQPHTVTLEPFEVLTLEATPR